MVHPIAESPSGTRFPFLSARPRERLDSVPAVPNRTAFGSPDLAGRAVDVGQRLVTMTLAATISVESSE
jgi:hypothetical protein